MPFWSIVSECFHEIVALDKLLICLRNNPLVGESRKCQDYQWFWYDEDPHGATRRIKKNT